METRDEVRTQSQPSTEPHEKVFRFISDPKHKENLSGRVRAACLNCRRKKIKCSGEENCRVCQERGVVCEGFPQRKRPKKSAAPNEPAPHDADNMVRARSRVDEPKQSALRRASMTSNKSQASAKVEAQMQRSPQPPTAAETSQTPSVSSTAPPDAAGESAIPAYDFKKCQRLQKVWPSDTNTITNNWGLLGELDAQAQFGIFDSTPVKASPAPTDPTDTNDEINDWIMEELVAQPEGDYGLLPMQSHEPGLELCLVESRSSEEPEADLAHDMELTTALTPEDNANMDTERLGFLDDVIIQDLDGALGDDITNALNRQTASALVKRNEQMSVDFSSLPPIHIWKQLQRMINTKSLGEYDGPLFEWPSK